jgi:hypothetical protein
VGSAVGEEDRTVAGQSEMTFGLLDGAQAATHADELLALRAGGS